MKSNVLNIISFYIIFIAGALNDWWSPSSERHFNQKARCMIQQYENYVSEQTQTKVNGFLTLQENIADNGGVKQAYQAYGRYTGCSCMIRKLKFKKGVSISFGCDLTGVLISLNFLTFSGLGKTSENDQK